jgi:hypothetical protein
VIEDFHPLLVVERHRKAAETIQADRSLLADSEFEGATIARFNFLLQRR